MSNSQAISEVWQFFDAEGKGYVESAGLAEALAARLGAVEPDNLQARASSPLHSQSWPSKSASEQYVLLAIGSLAFVRDMGIRAEQLILALNPGRQ